MDFVADNLFNGRRIRALAVVDNFSCECVAIEVGGASRRGCGRGDGTDKADTAAGSAEAADGQRQRIYLENAGPLGVRNRVTMDFSRPGKPTDNTLVESFKAACVTNT